MDVQLGERVQPWLSNDAGQLIEDLAERLDFTVRDTSLKFAEIRLRAAREDQIPEVWCYHPWFGGYGELD
ncbi:hypothetical protein ABHF33_03515 [Chitinibacter sp. FCG-7]|uniref:Uncharacterized protein n=1 Tax=Chitinibacter mangrovi TaxID=3153927 RepID=A0AAU7FBS6_9NEIS